MSNSKYDYLCPSCRSHLKINEHITLAVKTNDGIRALILLSPIPGDYTLIHHPTLKFKKGAHVDFFCPACQVNLVARDINDNLAQLIMVDQQEERRILFSEIFGERCTYTIREQEIEKYGEDSGRYANFFGATYPYDTSPYGSSRD